MKYKKGLIFIFLLLCFLSIAGSWASDAGDGDIQTGNGTAGDVVALGVDCNENDDVVVASQEVDNNDVLTVIDGVSDNVVAVNPETSTTLESSTTANYTISKGPSDLRIVVFNETYPDEVECIVYTDVDLGLKYNLTVTGDGGVVYSSLVPITNRVGHFDIGVLDAGHYTATIFCIENEMYESIGNYTTFEVSPRGTHFEVDISAAEITYGETATVMPILPYGSTGTITYYLNDGTFLGELAYDENLILPILDAGSYVIIANYSGDIDYLPAVDSVHLIVDKVNTVFEVRTNVSEITYGETATVMPILPADATGAIKYYLADGTVLGELAVGENLTLPMFDAGSHVIYANYSGDTNFFNATANATLTVNKAPTAIILDNETLDLKVKDIGYSLANLTPAGAGNLTYVSSNESVVVVVDGAYLACGKGTAIITVSFAGNENYTAAENRTIRVTVTLKDASVSVENATLDLKVGERFDLNATSVPDYLYIEYVSSNSSVVSVTDYGIVTAVGEGTAVITLTVGNNETYAFNSTNVTVTVSRIASEIASSAITTVYNVNKDLLVTLKDEKGNPISDASITVDLNGAKTYSTDSNGQIKVSTKGLAPKTYSAKITFNGDDKYLNSTKDVKVTIKKAIPKLTAKKKTFKTSVKTKKYTVTLKDNTGKAIKKAKVTLKVKGKTYKATTNSKGKATFKIKNLNKKGTFKATVTYKGNKYYNKATKKAKIKVIVTFKTVSKGSKNKATVKEIQQALKNNGYYLTYDGHYLKIDGIYHGCTERSVKEFQHDKRLKVTGKVDEKTAKKLGII